MKRFYVKTSDLYLVYAVYDRKTDSIVYGTDGVSLADVEKECAEMNKELEETGHVKVYGL